MKIAVSATGDKPDSAVDQRFGRAAFFVVFDEETGGWQAEGNSMNLNAPSGAGIQSAAAVSRTGAKAVLTGHCGPKAFQALRAAGIAVVVGVGGTVREAVEAFRKGALKPAEGPDVAGHGA